MKKEEKGNKVQSQQEKMEVFFKEYKNLCNKYGFQIIVNPAFKARDDGTWSIVLQSSIGKLPKQ